MAPGGGYFLAGASLFTAGKGGVTKDWNNWWTSGPGSRVGSGNFWKTLGFGSIKGKVGGPIGPQGTISNAPQYDPTLPGGPFPQPSDVLDNTDLALAAINSPHFAKTFVERAIKRLEKLPPSGYRNALLKTYRLELEILKDNGRQEQIAAQLAVNRKRDAIMEAGDLGLLFTTPVVPHGNQTLKDAAIERQELIRRFSGGRQIGYSARFGDEALQYIVEGRTESLQQFFDNIKKSGSTSAYSSLMGGGLAGFGGISQVEAGALVQGNLSQLIRKAEGQRWARRTGVSPSLYGNGSVANTSNQQGFFITAGKGGKRGRRGKYTPSQIGLGLMRESLSIDPNTYSLSDYLGFGEPMFGFNTPGQITRSNISGDAWIRARNQAYDIASASRTQFLSSVESGITKLAQQSGLTATQIKTDILSQRSYEFEDIIRYRSRLDTASGGTAGF